MPQNYAIHTLNKEADKFNALCVATASLLFVLLREAYRLVNPNCVAKRVKSKQQHRELQQPHAT
jgi:hypothetical protein